MILHLLNKIFSSAGIDILRVLCMAPYKECYLRELAKESGISPAHTGRMLDNLMKQGIVRYRKSGRQDFYRIDLENQLAKETFELFHLERKLSLSAEFRAAMDEFCTRLKEKANKDLVSVILFGSVAKGNANLESDLDILVISKKPEKTKELTKDAFRDISWFYGRHIEDHVHSMEGFDSRYKEGNELIINVLRDGIVFHDNSFYVNYLKKELPSPSREYIRGTIAFARGKLRSIDDISGKYPSTAIIPLRIAVRDAGRILLLSKGILPGSRHDLPKQVSRFDRKNGELIKKVNRMFESHETGGKEFKKEDLLKYRNQAEKFLKKSIEVFEGG